MEALLERDQELAAVRQGVAGNGGLLRVEGGAGIGKTSLLAVGAYEAQQLDREVLWDRASDLESGFGASRLESYGSCSSGVRRSGQRTAARDPLERAPDLAARAGARPLAARVRDELKATGARRPPRDWRSGVESLTPSARRIVRPAVDGLSNREIARTCT